ncbi:glycosyltransferase family 4 protein [Christiangramia crocea]|uniref:Glycosyltransferase family 4 protein n=1 Tax=Christiangramia crocea TaxID=2904124 RepID=A0A9X2A912_9FLAO|nr:glycosyltransferase family 4 protein [Gramella crocea]MCG9973037.1 glycosyltransferase family 4 protein [Gramella crocea]
MHIAFLTPEYPHELTGPSGGLGTSIKNLADSLVRNNIRVSVIVYEQSLDRELEENGIRFYLLKHQHYAFGGWFFHRKYIQKFLNRLIEKEKVEVIEATDWTGITAFMRINCPVVIRLNGSDAYFCEMENRKQKLKNRLFEKVALKNADHHISVSQFTAIKTNEIFNLELPFSIIPNSIEIDKFLPAAKKPVENRILYFGTVIRKKGVLELSKIFNEVVKERPDSELVIIGKDVIDIFENRSTIELFRQNLSEKATERFSYLGAVDYSEVKTHIAEAAVVVLPSFAEALPMTWIEAMAMEKAVVTSNIGWAPEVMVDGKTGFMEDPRSHKAYAEKIVRLLDNEDLRESVGKQAREQVKKKFSSEVVVKKNIEFYKKILHHY